MRRWTAGHARPCHAFMARWDRQLLSIAYEGALHATLAHEVAPSGALHVKRVSGSQSFY